MYGKNTSPFFLLSFAGIGIDSSQLWKHVLKMSISPSGKDWSQLIRQVLQHHSILHSHLPSSRLHAALCSPASRWSAWLSSQCSPCFYLRLPTRYTGHPQTNQGISKPVFVHLPYEFSFSPSCQLCFLS